MVASTSCALRLLLLSAAALQLGGCTSADVEGSPASASSRPAAANLLARMRQACGGGAWDRVQGWHETGRVDVPGMPGVTYEAFHDIRTLATLYVQRLPGGVERRRGYDGVAGWRLGPDGAAEINRDPAALRTLRRDLYVSSFGFFFPDRFPAEFEILPQAERDGRVYDILRVTPADADSAELWIDRATDRIGRIVAANETAELGDYRSFDGVCTATTGRQSDGDPAHDIVLHVETVTTGPIDPAIFSAPRAPPGP